MENFFCRKLLPTLSIVITYPYPLGKRITEEKLIRCGREKFLEKGYAEANERQIMEYICAHRQECELVLEKCSGSKYEVFRDEVFSNMQTVFQDYYDMDYRLFLTKAIGIHADVGTQSLIGLYPLKFPPKSDGLLQIRFIFEQFHLFCHFDCKIHIAVCSRSGDPVGSHHIFFTGERRFDPL